MLAFDYTATQSDNDAEWRVQLSDENGPIDLTGATATMRCLGRDTLTVLTRTAVVDPDAVGVVSYTFLEADLAVPDAYDVTWHAVWTDGTELTYPNPTRQQLLIVPALAAA